MTVRPTKKPPVRREKDLESPARRRFNTDEYHRMADTGILGPDERVELLDGEIYVMAAMGSKHFSRIVFGIRWFTGHVGDRAAVCAQSPMHLSSGAEPEPDLMLLRPRTDDYANALPTAEDVLLVIEIAESSLRHDRNRKLPIYAHAGIIEVWIVDLTANQVLIFRDPAEGAYRTTLTATRAETIAPLAFPDLILPVGELLPE